MEIPVSILLHQHSTRGHKRSIGHDKEEEVGVGVSEDRMLEESIFEFQEQGLVIWKPLPCSVLLHQEKEWLNDVGEIRNKLAIEIAEAHE